MTIKTSKSLDARNPLFPGARQAAITIGLGLVVSLGFAIPAPAQAVGAPSVGSVVAAAKKPVVKKFKNCAALNKVYKHGVGKPGAKDKVKGKTKAVTNFTKNAAVYNANRHLDRDKDGIACEKR